MFNKAILNYRRSNLLLTTIKTIGAGFSSQIFLLVSGPLVARMLGVEGRGYLAALSVWAVALFTLGNLGVPMASIYYISRKSNLTEKIIGESYRLAFIQILLLIPLLALILFLWSNGKPITVKVSIYPTLLMIPAGLKQQYALSILQAKQRFNAFNIIRQLPAAFYAISIVILFFLGERRIYVIVIAWVLAYLLSSIIATILAKKNIGVDWQGDALLRRKLLNFGLKGHLGAVSPLESLRLDQLLASFFLSPAGLGFYVVAYAFTNLPRFISQSAGMVSYPAIAYRKENPSAENLMWRYFWGVTLLNCFLSAVLIISIPFLIPMLFGKDFSGSIRISQILIIGATFGASRKILVECIRGLGFPQVSTYVEMSMYPWLLTVCLFSMWKYGAIGLAFSVCAGYILSLVVAIIVWKYKKRKFFDAIIEKSSDPLRILSKDSVKN